MHAPSVDVDGSVLVNVTSVVVVVAAAAAAVVVVVVVAGVATVGTAP